MLFKYRLSLIRLWRMNHHHIKYHSNEKHSKPYRWQGKTFALYSSTPGVQAPPALAHDAGELEEYFTVGKCVSWRTIHDKEKGDHELYLFEVARTC
jgi:hypothetical protein